MPWQRRIVHVRLEAHAHRHRPAGLADAAEILDRLVAIDALVFGRSRGVGEALFDDLAPGDDEDVENLAVSWTDSGGVDQRKVGKSGTRHDGHLGSDPTTQANADQVD